MAVTEDDILRDWMPVSSAGLYVTEWIERIRARYAAGEFVDEDEDNAACVVRLLIDAQLRKLGFHVETAEELRREMERRQALEERRVSH